MKFLAYVFVRKNHHCLKKNIKCLYVANFLTSFELFVLLVGGRSNLNGEKLLTHGTRDANCSNRFCFCFEKLNRMVSAELFEPSEKKLT